MAKGKGQGMKKWMWEEQSQEPEEATTSLSQCTWPSTESPTGRQSDAYNFMTSPLSISEVRVYVYILKWGCTYRRGLAGIHSLLVGFLERLNSQKDNRAHGMASNSTDVEIPGGGRMQSAPVWTRLALLHCTLQTAKTVILGLDPHWKQWDPGGGPGVL